MGLVGEGSECFGFDDEFSRDHDWGPGFCLWLTKEDLLRWGERAALVYRSLPMEFLGFRRLNEGHLSAGRVGVLEINYFYQRYLGPAVPPQTLRDWRRLRRRGSPPPPTARSSRIRWEPFPPCGRLCCPTSRRISAERKSPPAVPWPPSPVSTTTPGASGGEILSRRHWLCRSLLATSRPLSSC